MKKAALIFAGLILLSLAWMAFVRQPLAPIPEICAPLSDEVEFDFSINTMDYSGLEFSLNKKIEGQGMYVQFKMANSWKTGRTGLVCSGIKPTSSFKGGMSPKDYLKDPKRAEKGDKDFSDFMKDSKGKPVSSYSFKQMLVEGKDGKTYMQITYDGVAMELIQTLEIARPITLPAHISRQFVPDGIVQFQSGTITMDKKINGFYIPVTIR